MIKPSYTLCIGHFEMNPTAATNISQVAILFRDIKILSIIKKQQPVNSCQNY